MVSVQMVDADGPLNSDWPFEGMAVSLRWLFLWRAVQVVNVSPVWGEFRRSRDIDREFSRECRYAERLLIPQTARIIARRLEISGESECRPTLLIRPR